MQAQTKRIAIVTGASRLEGIGAAVCQALAEDGVDIFFTHWLPYDKKTYGQAEDTAPIELQHRLQASGVRCEHAAIDLSDTYAPEKILDLVETTLGNPSILINNATFDEDEASYKDLTAATLDTFYAINVRGPILLSIEFAKRFRATSSGRIINLTSGQGRGAMPGKLPYVTTKGAIDAFTVTLAAELGPQGITVNAVDPGPTDTGWMNEEIKKYLVERTPMGRTGMPVDAARLIRFLASEDGGWVSGQIIRSTGGF